MPKIIELKKDATDGLWVQAIMYFPNDEYLRRSWYTSEVIKGMTFELPSNKLIQISKDEIDLLIDAPSSLELKEKKIEAIKKGVVAGDVLASIYLMDMFDMSEPSIKKAIHISKRFAETNTFGNSERMRISQKSIKGDFNEYKSVAHLWAAFRLNLAYPYTESSKMFFEDLSKLLSVSKGIFNFGTNFIPYRAKHKEPILKTEEMWALPEEIQSSTLTSSRFPDELKRLLADYDSMEYQY